MNNGFSIFSPRLHYDSTFLGSHQSHPTNQREPNFSHTEKKSLRKRGVQSAPHKRRPTIPQGLTAHLSRVLQTSVGDSIINDEISWNVLWVNRCELRSLALPHMSITMVEIQ
uniref:Uncharacterized protein n=1 Tax=Nelumbo nucifera TaxID=4432 RepID=A0A822XRU6_NELNU|nr:TPA_asm: hypothetical protein HUJ06_023856 [Nelumbo nucifera]